VVVFWIRITGAEHILSGRAYHSGPLFSFSDMGRGGSGSWVIFNPAEAVMEAVLADSVAAGSAAVAQREW